MKKLIFAFALILLASCTSNITDRVYVENVSESDNSDYLYKVCLSSDNGVFYYTNYKFQIGDSLVSVGEVSIQSKKAFEDAITLNDSLIKENQILKKKIEEIEMYNQILIGITRDVKVNALK